MNKFILLIVCFIISITNAATAQNSDVMLQAFNWTSSTNTTGWYNVVTSKATTIKNAGFNTIWLPPPSKSAAREGYLPSEWYNLASTYGSQAQLQSTIQTLHAQNIKVLADIVINHRVGSTSWADFQQPAWGCWAVCNNDEWSGRCGGNDTGDGYSAARDIDHNNTQVQNDVIAWLSWLKGTIGFDGWRYDYVKGYGGNFIKQYNTATSPYFSVGELWDPNRQLIQNWVDAAQQSSAAFDFSTKGILQNAFNANNLSSLSNGGQAPGLIGWSPCRAVTFLDNHDTGSSQNLWPFPSGKVMQGYAYIITHPGIPMVFWDHYFDWGLSAQIDALIKVRKDNGLTCSSSLNIQTAQSNVYAAIIDGKVAMKIGSGNWSPNGAGWTLRASGTDYAVWDKTVPPTVTASVSPAGPMSFTTSIAPSIFTSVSNGAAATVYYTTDGTTPTTASPSAQNTVAFTFTATTTLKFFAMSQGISTAVQTHVYTKAVNQAPVLTVVPNTQTFSGTLTITLSATDDNSTPTIYYTTDGTNPTSGSMTSIGTKTLTISATTTIKAFAKDATGLTTLLQSKTYTLVPGPTGFTLYFKRPTTFATANNPYIHYWGAAPTANLADCIWPCTPMQAHSTTGWFKYSFANINSTNLLFHDNAGRQTANLTRSTDGWYDGGTATWSTTAPPTVTTYTMDGTLDANVPIIATNTGINLYATASGGKLYVATQAGATYGNKDVFVFVTNNLAALTAAPWLKGGQVPAGCKILGCEGASTYATWTGATASAVAKAGATTVEGTLVLASEFASAPTQLYIGVGVYGTADAGVLEKQCPAAVTANGNIETTELILYTLPAQVAGNAPIARGVQADAPPIYFDTALRIAPNPTVGQSAIIFSLNAAMPVKMVVQNIQGQAMEILQNGTLEAGTHQFILDVNNYPAGVYLLQYDNGTSISTHKIVVNK